MQKIRNRRFMFNPHTGTLILGCQYSGSKLYSSHAEEHAAAKTDEAYDDFIRGWIGTGKGYQDGVIHFSPNISSRNTVMFHNGFDTLEMFFQNGAKRNTVVRGFGEVWEQPFSNFIKEVEAMAENTALKTTPIELESENMRDKVKEITDKLENGIKELFDSEKYKTFLSTMAKFYHYSYNNSLLIMFQKPDATAIAGYTDWIKKFHRYVRKGEKGIKILAPAPYKKDVEVPVLDGNGNNVIGADGKKLTRTEEIKVPAFKVTTVFDVSQTEGEPLPSITEQLKGDIAEYEKFFAALKEISPVPIAFENIQTGANGYYHLEEKRIAIQDDMSELQTIKTAIHEIAHAKLHALPDKEDEKSDPDVEKIDRNTKEVQAESISYTVCQRFGLDTSDYSFGYIAGWSSGRDIKELKKSLKTIRQTAAEIITGIEERMPELAPKRDKPQIDTDEQSLPEPKTVSEHKSVKKQLSENKEKCASAPKAPTKQKTNELKV